MSERPPISPTGCVWVLASHHAKESHSKRARDLVTCADCKTKIPYERSWVTVPYGIHGRLPLPVFIHCMGCMLRLDPTTAYQVAWSKDSGAAGPDPIKIERERELNEQLGWDQPLDLTLEP